MNPIAAQVEGLGKKYRIGALEQGDRTLRETLTDVFVAPFRKASSLLSGNASGAADMKDEIWALRDVSFEVPRGQVLGIIGKNGAGKSTLLKILSRITEPTEGFVELRGRVGSLLEVGTGFHPELTGRENVYLNGAILGMTRSEIERKFDEIVEFSGVGKFLDTPVKHYSSGMYVRLAFAVAAHLEPEILVVDEVLSVGDASFQKKCLGKMGDVASSGRTVLLVSHNMATINRLCTRAIWLHEGQIHRTGDPGEVVSAYLSSGTTLLGERSWEEGFSNKGIDDFKIDAVSVQNLRGERGRQLDVREPFAIELCYRVLEKLPVSRVGIVLTSADGVVVFDAYDSDEVRYASPRSPGRYVSRCTVPGNLLSPGRYFVSINAGVPNVRNLAYLEGALTLDLVDAGAVGSHMRGGRRGIIRPELCWEQELRDL